MNKKEIEKYTSQATQQYVMMLMHIQNELDVSIPSVEASLTDEDGGMEWVVTVKKKPIDE